MPLSLGSLLDGRYEIISSLGSGGMGEVYLGKDLRLGRDVAIKVLPETQMDRAESMARFEWEAKVVAALSHPNIRPIYDLVLGEQLSYAVMEFLEGETLRMRLQRGPMPIDEISSVAVFIAEGLVAAHAKGVVHRDLKPENIFFTRDGQVKILDFGLARVDPDHQSLNDHLASPSSLSTSPGTVMGTASYMAPEQVRGERLDARCDLFAFGCVLFEMITGKRAFSGGSLAEIMAAVLKDEPPPLLRKAGAVPVELGLLVQRCLVKVREDRLQDAKDAVRLLRSLQSGAQSEPPTAPYYVRAAQSDLPSDEPTRALAPGTIIGASSSGSARPSPSASQPMPAAGPEPGSWLSNLRRAMDRWFGGEAIRSIAVLPFSNSSGDPGAEYLADGIAESLIDRLGQVPDLRVMSWHAVARFKGMDLDPRAVGGQLRVRALVLGRVKSLGGDLSISVELVDTRSNSHLWGDRYHRRFSDILALQQEISTQVAERLQVKISGEVQRRLAQTPTTDAEAFQLYLKGRHAWRRRTPQALREAVDHFRAAIERDPHYALAYAGLADAYTLLSFLVGVMPPKEALPQAKAAAQRALDLAPELADAHTSMGMIMESYDWNWSGAETAHRKALELDPKNPNLFHRLGMHMLYRNRLGEAADCFKQAHGLDPLSPLFQVGLGLPAYFGGQVDLAIREFRQAITLAPRFLIAHLMLGLALVEQGNAADGVTAFESALEIGETPEGLAMLGHACAKSNQLDRAKEVQARLREMSSKLYVSAYGKATIKLALGDVNGALDELEESLRERCELLVYLRIDPRLKELKGHPRFQALLRKIGLD
jgi:eukaryotic-like serine/threonine-protein kinase